MNKPKEPSDGNAQFKIEQLSESSPKGFPIPRCVVHTSKGNFLITEKAETLRQLCNALVPDGNALNLQMALEAEVRKVIAALKDSNDLGLTLGDGVVSWPLGAEILYRLEKCLSSHAPESSSGDTRRLDWLERHPEKLSHCSWVNTARGRIFSMGHDLDPTVGDCHKTLREAIDKALQDARAASDGVERDSPRQLPKSSPSSPLQETEREEGRVL